MRFNYDKFDTSNDGYSKHLEDHNHLSFMNNMLLELITNHRDIANELLLVTVEENSIVSPEDQNIIFSLNNMDDFDEEQDDFVKFYDSLTNGEPVSSEIAKTFEILQTSLTALLGMTEDEINEYVLEDAAPEVVAEDAPTTVVETSPEVVAEDAPTTVVETSPEVVAEDAPTTVVETSPEVVAEDAPTTTVVETSPEVVAEDAPTTVVETSIKTLLSKSEEEIEETCLTGIHDKYADDITNIHSQYPIPEEIMERAASFVSSSITPELVENMKKLQAEMSEEAFGEYVETFAAPIESKFITCLTAFSKIQAAKSGQTVTVASHAEAKEIADQGGIATIAKTLSPNDVAAGKYIAEAAPQEFLKHVGFKW